jgi:ribonuclease-3
MPFKLDQLQARIGYTFKDVSLLSLALTHDSCRNDGLPTNERLELLGDKVAGVIFTEAVYEKYPFFAGARITAISTHLLSNVSMYRRAQAIKLGEHLQFGRGFRLETLSSSAMAWILADAFEALIAAIYLDGGLDAARAFVLSKYANDLNNHHS